MQIFSVHRLPLFQAPEAGANAGDPPPVDPAVVANSDPANPPPAPVADPPAADPPAVEAGGDPPPAPVAEAHQHGNKGKTPWWQNRISEESHAKNVEREARLKAEERAANAEAMLERLRNGNNAPPPANNTRQPPAADDPAVEARAQEILAQRQIQGVISAGVATFPDWDEKAAILGSAGAADPNFIMDVIGVVPTGAHEFFHKLADNPAKAAQLAKMSQRDRIIELAKMTAQPAAPAAEVKPATPPKAVSKAPPPPPALQPGSTQAIDWRDDKTSDADFSRGWEENAAKRAQRLRR